MSRFTTIKYLVLGILDFVIIGIIIYGLTDWVYDGYPSWVPYILIIFFLFMATTRFYKFSTVLKAGNSLDSHDLESLFSDDSDKNAEENGEVSANGFRRRKSKNTTQVNDD